MGKSARLSELSMLGFVTFAPKADGSLLRWPPSERWRRTFRAEPSRQATATRDARKIIRHQSRPRKSARVSDSLSPDAPPR